MARDIQLDHTPSNTRTPELFRRRFSRKTFLKGTLGLLGAAAIASLPGAALASEIGHGTGPAETSRQTPWRDAAPLESPVIFGEYPGKDPEREAQAREKILKALAVAPNIDPDLAPMSADFARWLAGSNGRNYRENGPDGWIISKYALALPTSGLPERDRAKAMSVFTEVATTSFPANGKQFMLQISINEAMDPGRMQTYRDLYSAWRFSQLAQEQACLKMEGADIATLKPQVTGADFVAPIWTAALAEANAMVARVQVKPDFSDLELASETLPVA